MARTIGLYVNRCVDCLGGNINQYAGIVRGFFQRGMHE